MNPVITQVFPDEFHLNTLDQLLSAIARLNPHVNIKAIVIGLMDRLSSYAARESESEPQDDRKKTEEEATTRLLSPKFQMGTRQTARTRLNYLRMPQKVKRQLPLSLLLLMNLAKKTI